MAQSELPRVGGIEGMEESLDVSQRTDVPKLRKGAIGLGGVLFLTVTGSAPISAMLFNTPIMVGYGQGVGAPAAFMFAAIVLVVFSVGYVAMSRKKTAAGGFYSYISHGLGREIGFGAGVGSPGGLRGLQAVPGGRLRLLRQPQAGVTRRPRRLGAAGPRHGRRHRRAHLLRRQFLRQD